MFEKRVLRRIFGPKWDEETGEGRKIHNEEINDLYTKRLIVDVCSVYYPFLSLHNAVCFIILTYLVPALFTFYIWSVLKFKKIPAPKG